MKLQMPAAYKQKSLLSNGQSSSVQGGEFFNGLDNHLQEGRTIASLPTSCLTREGTSSCFLWL